MDSFARAVRRLSALCGWLAAACLAAACLVVCQMVVFRYALGASTIWQTEFVLYAVVAATLIGSPYVLAVGGHVNVDVLARWLGPAAGRGLRLVSALIGISFCVVLTVSGWRYFYEAWASGWVTESVWAPRLWVLLLPLPVGMGLLALQYSVEILAAIAGREFGGPDADDHGKPS